MTFLKFIISFRDGHFGYSLQAPTNLQVVTVEFSVDLDNGLRRGKQNVVCLWPVIDTFQLEIH